MKQRTLITNIQKRLQKQSTIL